MLVPKRSKVAGENVPSIVVLAKQAKAVMALLEPRKQVHVLGF